MRSNSVRPQNLPLAALDIPVRDAAYWEKRERELKESRDSWDR